MRHWISIVVVSWFFLACSDKTAEQKADLPRPKGYNRIILPKAKYQDVEKGHPFTFEVSQYAQVMPDTVSWAEPHWLYIYYPQWHAFIQLTYKPLNKDQKKLANLINDAYILAAKHQGKARGIQEYVMTTRSGRKAGIIELDGEVATSFQFYTTDSLNHYLRGAVYVKTATQNDSLAPVIQFLKKDAMHLIQTLQWKP
ncbi:gliding motility lipoprotein GldD [Cytophagaceae bacterium 50C-KIRBA]|uniref:Gliding motility lipoprotein GldD n=1 Tax=Aquirufa beregesia TaxID=2516556 RepID=A0ABX0EX12_9BACT|nr:gliding motility lipoprotein GldD [Aquirufa beregesia]NGZ44989.1 gliding motility lipoprotein GldD [Aquirufa beregesia]